jgi:CspA family cold shock protein
MQGNVRWYSHQGFGFIDPSDSTDGKALYFHVCDVRDRVILKAGDAVTFDVIQAPKGLKCINVQVVKTKEAIKCPQTATI